jgi:hypothetical protein
MHNIHEGYSESNLRLAVNKKRNVKYIYIYEYINLLTDL